MFKFHPKDSLTFTVIDTNPTKGTVTLLPTFGSIVKINLIVVGVVYLSHIVRDMVEMSRQSAVEDDLKQDPYPRMF